MYLYICLNLKLYGGFNGYLWQKLQIYYTATTIQRHSGILIRSALDNDRQHHFMNVLFTLSTDLQSLLFQKWYLEILSREKKTILEGKDIELFANLFLK